MLCMYACMCACMHVCICMYGWMCVYVYKSMYMHSVYKGITINKINKNLKFEKESRDGNER